MLTACGIETWHFLIINKPIEIVATVLTACGIETDNSYFLVAIKQIFVATVLTACGIET